ncbi:hypothetical protein TNCV_2298041 [Trichonephila clavipes]|nr:hypothetical protein TNCV_2298041 [Trichonephila clavipes]
MEFLTFGKVPGMLLIRLATTDIRAIRSSTEGMGVSYTKLFMRPQKKSSYDRGAKLPRELDRKCRLLAGLVMTEHFIQRHLPQDCQNRSSRTGVANPNDFVVHFGKTL